MWFVCLLFCVVDVSAANIIRGSYGGEVLLTTTNTNDVPDSVQWFYEVGGTRETVYFQMGEDGSIKLVGENYTGRVALDYATASLTISDLQCEDNKTYICEVAAPTEVVATHTVLLGLPVPGELTVTVEVDGDAVQFEPGACGSNPPLAITTSSSSVAVRITSSVQSAPGVTFSVDGEAEAAECEADGQCPGEVRCRLDHQYTIDASDPSDIIVTIHYEDVEPWTFCITPGKW